MWYGIVKSVVGVRSVKTKGPRSKLVDVPGVEVFWLEESVQRQGPAKTTTATAPVKALIISPFSDWVALECVSRWGKGILRLDSKHGVFHVLDINKEEARAESAREECDDATAARDLVMATLDSGTEATISPQQLVEITHAMFPTEVHDVLDMAPLDLQPWIALCPCSRKRRRAVVPL